MQGYWRASQAVKGGHNGAQKAMRYLLEGMRRCLGGGTTNEVVDFVAEICDLIPSAPRNGMVV
ncbi:hypothetical protein DPMN_135515 [Dreissena polymorpha]|uniref:Uncharacterized protein n=1 Tax=Dreissena polymorpha TaxID=45954 RepID=A0A9D4G429_DREPO|nr:hypothetical protein DPMN_135515 [Dreissena polymorpha]